MCPRMMGGFVSQAIQNHYLRVKYAIKNNVQARGKAIENFVRDFIDFFIFAWFFWYFA